VGSVAVRRGHSPPAVDGAELGGIARGGDARGTGRTDQAEPAHVLQQSSLVDKDRIALGEDEAAAGGPAGEPIDRDRHVGVDFPTEALGGFSCRGDSDDTVARGLAHLGDGAEDFTLARAGLGREEPERAAGVLIDGGLLLGG